MRIENTSRIPTPELRKALIEVLKTAPLGRARTCLRGKDGLYVVVNNARYSRVAGRIYPSAIRIYRKGKPIAVRGYIKLYVFATRTLDDIKGTFAHELSHFKDYYDYEFMNYGQAPYGKEKRAQAFTEKTMAKIQNKR